MRKITQLKAMLVMLLMMVGVSAWGEEVTTTYTFTGASWTAKCNGEDANWSSVKSGGGFSNGGVQVTTGSTGANATSPKEFTNVKKIVVTYCTNARAGKGTVSLKVGDTSFGSQNITAPSSGGTTQRTFELTNEAASGFVNISVACSTNSIYICAIEITEDIEGGEAQDATWSVDPNEIEVKADKRTKATITTNYNGILGVESNNPSVATATVEGKTLVVTGVSVGTTSLHVTGDANVLFNAIDETINVTVLENTVEPGTYDIVPNNDFWGTNYGGSVSLTSNGLDITSELDNVTINMKNGSSTNGYINDLQTRVYSKYLLTFSVPSGFAITKIAFTADGSNWTGTHTADVGTMKDNKNWVGNSNKVTISFDGTCRITKISVTYVAITSGTINLVAQGVMPGVNNEGGMMEGLNLYFATFSHGKDVIITGDDLFAVCPVGVDEGYLSTLPCEQSMAAVTDQEVMDEEGCAIGYFVPANTGVLVVSMGNEATYYFPVADPSNMISDFDPEGINMLQPASKDKAELPNHKFYMLAYGDNSKNPASLGFYWGKADGAAFTSREGSAYLAVPTDSNVKGFAFSSIADAIKNVEVKNNNGAIYNLQGQRVEKAQKGLYIVNGKKVVVK